MNETAISEPTINESTVNESAMNESTINESTISPADRPLEYTMESVLSRIDMILKDTAHISQAIDAFEKFKMNESPMGGEGDSARAKALGAIVGAREETNRKLLGILETMYEDLKPRRTGFKDRALDLVEKTVNNTGLPTEDKQLLFDMLTNIKNLE